MKFKSFQLHDYAAAALADGLVLAHDTGLGKSLAAVTWPLLKLGFNRAETPAVRIHVKGAVLIVAPGDLHDQLRAEWTRFFRISPVSIDGPAGLDRILVNRRIPHGFYLTSYTRLTTNGVRKLESLVKAGTEVAILSLNLTGKDLQEFYDSRGTEYKEDYENLSVGAECSLKQLDSALAAKMRLLDNWDNQTLARAHRDDLQASYNVLVNLIGPFIPAPFSTAGNAVRFIWRELVLRRIRRYSDGIGEIRDGIKCVYSPSLADLTSHLFGAMVVDEGVKMKGADTAVGRGIRQMCPKFRLVLTATPVKNRLPDIFWLAWWAAGGSVTATARWPYAGGVAEQEKFAATFMLSEFNKTRSKNDGGRKSRHVKLRPEICNIHLLWKALGPIVLRRRKEDIGQSIVKKVRHVYRVPMGLHQRGVYRYHLESAYVDKNHKPAPGAKLQALRVAAAAPDSHLLEAQAGGAARSCCSIPMPDAFGICGSCGSAPLTFRSPFSFTPKVACALTLIRDILQRGEQVAVFSAFNDPSDILSRHLAEADIDHFLLDGRMTQTRRGVRSAAFNAGDCPITLAGIDSMAEGHNWDRVNNIILTSYTWAADKIVQAINRAHRITSRRDINLYAILCDQSADRVLEDNVNEKNNSSELAIDGRLLAETAEEKSLSELLRDAMRDFHSGQDCPNEQNLAKTWPALREQLREASQFWRSGKPGPAIDHSTVTFTAPEPIAISASVALGNYSAIPVPMPIGRNVPIWRRAKLPV